MTSVIVSSFTDMHRKVYFIVEKDYQRNKFNMSHVKNSKSADTTPILFKDHNSARYFSEVLSVAISRTSEWNDAIELQDGELTIAPEYKDYMADDGVDYEYAIVIEVECLDDECVVVDYDD
ncbi:hypothetical protein PBCVNY2B_436L [Paramecium bursaria Chlorella virus NY2B]|uniref:Uncharacterized protein n=1 Tax=Paramecium bursaria Chlorella virus NYs1 TaxID=83442 RepID=M1I887_9PHYC|nr:hypothetical protein AR158_C380L [Paramecium bursaria Chlorella virus AR158]YP_009665379.1 hypothetical protein FK949_gp169 [Paramecium bursaria Chlorella virus NYs1]AGE54236.1 hypothetical protein PBCVIL52s1_454L [Paramecium bursaria Chlorella virus IL-5-2s1]AGE54876.1 hypothetical protein PBCVMA1D_320L [Paramecium bursaria Chlorella virus MA1D]AGE58351.1 hypothetical protein PBCVNY2B_436L [Paramecium bursaria Chlorella virus NY2B]ABU43925.1 hypothetical protein AR158_C380L [Paramecium bur